MPFYDLKCNNCEEEFSVRTSFSELKKTICPECGTKDVKQKFSSFSIGNNKSSCNTSSCTTPT